MKRVKMTIQEPLVPGSLYVAGAGLSSSILLRNRGIIGRYFVPVTITGLAVLAFFPKTCVEIVKGGELESPMRFIDEGLKKTCDLWNKK
jgi:hypothetical protein